MALPYQLVFTKIDKIKKSDIDKQKQLIEEQKIHYTSMHPDIIFTSSEKGTGIDQLRKYILHLIK
jgi:GTP-binding protein